ncbi:MAG TPA: hypothetical protein VGG66_03725, partial [Rhizomicrobium sp.]
MRDRLRSLAIILANVAAILFGTTPHAVGHGLPPVTIASSGRAHSHGARILYREGHYPQLSLPGGR